MNVNPEALLKCLNDAVLQIDKDGFIVYASPGIRNITGYSAEEVLGKNLCVLYNNAEDVLKAEYELGQAKKTGKFISESWRTRKDQSRYFGEMSLSAFYDDDKFQGYACILRDTTARKQHETELRKSEEHFRLMVEGVTDYAIFLLDPKGYILTWNEGAKRTKGWTADEIIGKHFSTFYTKEDLDDKKPERELKIAVATGKYEEEGWRVRKDGSLFWANVVITALFNDQNRHIGFSKVTRNLTERKENEESLRQSEERYRSLVEQVTDYGIFMMDEKGRIISWNEGARRINGYTPDEILGKYFSIFYPKEDAESGKPAFELKTAIKEGKYEEEGWRIKKDGTKFWASIVITAIYNNAGNHIGFSKVARDLTERKDAEKALRQSYDQYRQIADELKITNNELSYANEELEQFTSIVSHDLQEPVRTIKSFLQLMHLKLDKAQNSEFEIYLEKSINAADRMKGLIKSLLNYSQIGKIELASEKLSVAHIIQQVLQNLKSAIDASDAQIKVDAEVETIQGDPVQLMQLLQNLLSNALKFTKSKRPEISIICRLENGHVKFAVSDNGIGIEKNDLNKVFEIFRRLNTPKEYPGTGIGLAICKKIVDRHNGRIWPESRPGKGTTFYFTLHEFNKEQTQHYEKV